MDDILPFFFFDYLGVSDRVETEALCQHLVISVLCFIH